MERLRREQVADDDPNISFVTKIRHLERLLERTYNACDRGVIRARINRLIEQRDREI